MAYTFAHGIARASAALLLLTTFTVSAQVEQSSNPPSAALFSLPQVTSATLPGPNAPAAPAAGKKTAPQGLSGEQAIAQAARVLPPPPPNEFQQFLAAGSGLDLPLFGQEFFQSAPSTFAPVTDAPVAPDYVIGPGDEIVLRAWGQIEANLRLNVDRNGMLVIPKVGAIFVGGMRYQDAQGAIHAEMSKVYRNFEMAVTMGELRGIQIFVVGQARQPGSYTVGSMSTLVNALFAAGGPSSKGSVRRIQVKRGNKVITEFDLYDMLLKGDTSGDVRLRQGDVIVIPPAGPLVAVAGSISRPAVFELKRDATPLSEVLEWAGGLTTVTRGQSATVERIIGRESRKMAEFRLDQEGLKQQLHDGDLVTLFAISPRFDNAVSIRGFVAQPAKYPWREGLRVRDLLPDANAVTSADYWRSRNRPLLTDKLAAEVQNPRGDSKPQRTTIDHSLLATPEEVSWDYAVIERLLPNATTELIPFNLGAAVIQGDPRHNLLLQPGDILTVLSKTDVRVPRESQRRYIRLEGEFASAGVYSAQPGETLRQLVARVGGMTAGAYLFGAEFTRESTRKLQQKQLDESLDRMEQEVRRVAAESSRNATSPEDTESRKAQIEAQQSLVARLRGIQATGRIVLDLPDQAGVRDLPDLPLEDGDRFYVPPMPSVVSVFGSVFNPNTFVYREAKRPGDYLAQAGGPTTSADEASIYLLRADGSVVSQRQKGWFGGLGGERVMPGDAIVVPEDLERVSLSKQLKDWSQMFYQFALGVAGLKVLRN